MHIRLFFASVSFGLFASQPGQAQVETRGDVLALVGTWQLDLRRTHYGPGVDRRQRERMQCEVRDQLVHCTVESVRADGRKLTVRFAAPLTGEAAPVAGLADVDTVKLETGRHGIVHATFSYRGRPAFGYRAYPSDDHASLVIVSVDPRTRAALTSLIVYRRVGTFGRAMSPKRTLKPTGDLLNCARSAPTLV